MSTLALRIVSRNIGRHPTQTTATNGVRHDLQWRREGAALAREISSLDLVTALAWIHARAGLRKLGRREWTVNDDQTTAEALARAWHYGDAQALSLWSTPSWFSLLPIPPRRGAGYERIIGICLRAYRGGAIGVVLSYEEAMSLTGVQGRSTWRRWCVELEKLGLLRITPMWRTDAGKPCYARLLYRIGPALEQLGGAALVEGVEQTPGQRKWSRRIAIGLRRRARAARADLKAMHWQQCREGLRVVEAPPAELVVDEAPSEPTVAAELEQQAAAPAEAEAELEAARAPTGPTAGSSISVLHSDSCHEGADPAPFGAPSLKGRRSASAPSATPSSRRPRATTRPTDASSGRPTSPDALEPTASRSEALEGESREPAGGVELLERWIADRRPRGDVGRDALASIRAGLRRASELDVDEAPARARRAPPRAAWLEPADELDVDEQLELDDAGDELDVVEAPPRAAWLDDPPSDDGDGGDAS